MKQQSQRRASILALLAEAPQRLTDLRAALRPQPSIRSVQADLAWLRRQFPERVLAERDGRAFAWRFIGEPPRLLPRALAVLDEDQVAALIASRGLLRTPNPAHPAAEEAATAYHGALSRALDRLLSQAGLEAEARAVAPDALAISRFGVAADEEAAFPTCFAAIRAGAALRFGYTNNAGETHPVHAQPVRLLHIAGEWHLIAWAADRRSPPGLLKQYRLSRMTTVQRAVAAPAGCPLSGLRAEAAARMRDAFRATGSARAADRRRVTLALSPLAWPFVRGRRWGDRQTVDESPADLPPGWRRLVFVTTGLTEARHWVLSFGAEMRVEGPEELRDWVRGQARSMLGGAVGGSR